MSDLPTATVETPELPAAPAAIERWPHDRTRTGLIADDASIRKAALAMAIQPDAPIDQWAHELVRCVDLSRTDAIALQVATTIFCSIKTPAARHVVLPCLVTLATVENPPPVRRSAAHCFWLYQCIPAAAWASVSQMVFSDDEDLRLVAFGAALPHAEAGAAEIAGAAATVGASGWTTEGLDLLAASAGASEPRQKQIEAYVMRTLQGETNVSVMVAGYSALARLNPKGPGVAALAQVASVAPDWSDGKRALAALRQLEEKAHSAVPALVKQLVETDDPEREEALCHTLLRLQITDREVPIARTLQRVDSGPDQAVIAHCIFLGLHAKAFARAAPVVAARYATASDELKQVLDAAHEMLTGTPLKPAAPPAKNPRI